MAGGAVLFAMMNYFAKLASAEAPWMTVGAVRALVGAFVAIAVARMRGASLVAKDRRAILWRSLLGTASMAATFYALSSRSLSLADTVTLLNLTPVFLALLAPVFLGERTSIAVFLALALSLGGVVLVLHPTFAFGDAAGSVGPSSAVTAACAVLAAFMSSIAMMLLRRVGPTETSEAIAVHFSLFAAGSLGILALTDLRMPSARAAGCMLAAGICAGFAQIAITRAYSLERAARVSGMSYLSVVASALIGAALLDERPTLDAILGMTLVVAGGLVVTLTRDKLVG
jgi:drug/metabolite transporter (DMT)-like permease